MLNLYAVTLRLLEAERAPGPLCQSRPFMAQHARPPRWTRSSPATSTLLSTMNMPIMPAMAPWTTVMMARIIDQLFLKDFRAFF